jgi:hypothetical protein
MLDVIRDVDARRANFLKYNPRAKTDEIHTSRSHANNKAIMALIKADLTQRGYGTTQPDWFLATDMDAMTDHVVDIYENPEEALHTHFANLHIPAWNIFG